MKIVPRNETFQPVVIMLERREEALALLNAIRGTPTCKDVHLVEPLAQSLWCILFPLYPEPVNQKERA